MCRNYLTDVLRETPRGIVFGAVALATGICVSQKCDNGNRAALAIAGITLLFLFTICMTGEMKKLDRGRPEKLRRSIAKRFWLLTAIFLIPGFLIGNCAANAESRRYASFYRMTEEPEAAAVWARVSDVRSLEDGCRVYVKDACFEDGTRLEYDGILYYSDRSFSVWGEEEKEEGEMTWRQRFEGGQMCEPGDCIILFLPEGPEIFDTPTCPGQFDSRAYYRSRGVGWSAFAPEWEYCTRKEYFEVRKERTNGFAWVAGGISASISRRLYHLRRELEQGVEAMTRKAVARLPWALPADVLEGIVKGMVLGEKEWLDSGVRSLFADNGIAHVFAISGLHLRLVGMGLYRLLRKAKVKMTTACATAFSATVFYVLFTGVPLSGIRAMIMLGMNFGAICRGKSYSPFHALAGFMLVVLPFRPSLLFESSFLYSVLCVTAVHLAREVLSDGKKWKREEELLVGEEKKRARRKHREVLFVNRLMLGFFLSAVTCGIGVWDSGEYPIHAGVVNLVFLPLVGPFWVLLAVLTVLGSVCEKLGPEWLSGLLAWVLQNIAGSIAAGMVFVCEKIPAGTVNIATGRPALTTELIYYGIVALAAAILLWKARGRKPYRLYGLRLAVAGLPLVLVLLCGSSAPKKGMQAMFLDVGQGDCCVLRFGDGTVGIVDCGSSTVMDVGRKRLIPYLEYIGAGRTVDYVWLSHKDLDHVNGITDLLEDGYTIKRMYLAFDPYNEDITGNSPDMKEILKYVSRNGEEKGQVEALYYFTEGDRLQIAGTTVCGLAPPSPKDSLGTNDDSMVLLVQYGSLDLLFPGDISTDGYERFLTEEYAQKSWDVDVLKVPHHGSKYSSGEEFLQWCSPKTAVISVGENNYGHPADEVLERLQKIGAEVYITRENGSIMVEP